MTSKTRSRRESVLRSLYSSKSGLIVHCSAVENSGDAFVFAGTSDVGKSTLAKKLSKKMTVINDDMNVLRFSDDGILVSTYFTQEENKGYHYLINENTTGTLKAFLFPEKELEKESYIEQVLDKGLAWKRLLSCTAPPLKGEDELFSNYLEMVERLLVSVPFFSIHHNLNDSPEFVREILMSMDSC